jgi:hypothetical protein
MKCINKLLAVAMVLLSVASCGGGGGGGASVSGSGSTASGSTLASATFSTQVPGGATTMQSMQVIMLGGFGLTTDSKIASATPISDFFYGLLGIKTAIAANSSLNNLIYSLDTQGKLASLNLIESISSTDGSRSAVSLDLLSPGTNSLAPRLTGMLDTPKFILLAFKNLYKPAANGSIDRTQDANKCPILVLQKLDGKIYCLNLPPWCEDFSNCGDAHGNSSIQANGTGEIIYMQDENWHLYKVNLTDPTNISILKLTDRITDGAIQSLIVNAAGDAYVDIYTGVDFRNLQRIYKASGSTSTDFQTLPDQFLNCTLVGPASLGNENNFFFTDENNVLKKYTKQVNGSFVLSEAYRNSDWSTNPLNASNGRNCLKTIKVGNYAFQLPTFNTADNPTPNFVTEVLNPEVVRQTGAKTPRRITFPAVSKIYDMAACSNGFFVLARDNNDKDMIVKYAMPTPEETTISTGSQTEVLSASSNYTVSQFSVSSTCAVEIIGTNSISGSKVIASLGVDPANPTVKKTLSSGNTISKIIPMK